MKNWVKILTMAIVGAVFLIGVTSAQAIMTNGTETTYTASDKKITFVADLNSKYRLSPFDANVKVDEIFITPDTLVGTIYEFVIPNFYDPLPKKTVEITISGTNDSASGYDMAKVLDVFGADTPFSKSGPAEQVEGFFVSSRETSELVTELWEIFPNPDFEYVKIWVPLNFGLRGIKIVTQSVPTSNQGPVAICKDVEVSAEPGCSADASIDNGSYDPDDGDEITLDQDPPGPYELGDTVVTLTVTDEAGATDTCKATVTVIDEEPPVISSVTAGPDRLWPPNHKMVSVSLAVDATDDCELFCEIESVTSNEPDNGLGDGDTSPDWDITDDLTVDLRAERSGTGSGRIYTITVACTDESGNSSTDTAEVSVPHDNGNNKTISRSRSRSRRR